MSKRGDFSSLLGGRHQPGPRRGLYIKSLRTSSCSNAPLDNKAAGVVIPSQRIKKDKKTGGPFKRILSVPVSL